MDAADVLTFWLGELDERGLVAPEIGQRWWRKDLEFDRQVRAQFEPLWQGIMRGDHLNWLDDARGRLAYVIVLDQLSRNMFRGEPASFSGDVLALAAAAEGVERGHDQELPGLARALLYMPFMHSEDESEQTRGVELFAAQRDESQGELRTSLANMTDFAERHRAIVQRWGRFPHRNEILGRRSTPQELDFLKQPGSSF
jgi:uncharacterized protein (DUF924 family)